MSVRMLAQIAWGRLCAALLLLSIFAIPLHAQDDSEVSVWSLTTVTPTPQTYGYYASTYVYVQATNTRLTSTSVTTWSTIYKTPAPYITSTIVLLESSPTSTTPMIRPTSTASPATTTTPAAAATHSSIGAIAGGALGGIFLLLLAGIAFWAFVLRKKKAKPHVDQAIPLKHRSNSTTNSGGKLITKADIGSPQPISSDQHLSHQYPSDSGLLDSPTAFLRDFTDKPPTVFKETAPYDPDKPCYSPPPLEDPEHCIGGWEKKLEETESNWDTRRQHWHQTAQKLEGKVEDGGSPTELYTTSNCETFWNPGLKYDPPEYKAPQRSRAERESKMTTMTNFIGSMGWRSTSNPSPKPAPQPGQQSFPTHRVPPSAPTNPNPDIYGRNLLSKEQESGFRMEGEEKNEAREEITGGRHGPTSGVPSDNDDGWTSEVHSESDDDKKKYGKYNFE